MLRIEPVRPGDYESAVALLVGGKAGAGRGGAFLSLLSGPDAERCNFWWARSLGRGRAAAMTIGNPGRTAATYHSPAEDPGGVDVLGRLLRKLADATLDGGTVFVQVLLHPTADADAEAYLRAGYEHLARLTYLRRETANVPAEDPNQLAWTPLRPGQERRLGHVIAETYVDSQDCPDLLGLRTMEDVINGHKASGVFCPDGWFLPSRKDECVGCVLVNDAAERSDEAEVVYLGVRPAWRRRGIGRAMVRHALSHAARRGRRYVSLAVDAANTPAVRLYEAEGFREIGRKDVYIKRKK